MYNIIMGLDGAIGEDIAGCERPGLRERQRQARSAAILQAAIALVTDRGYDALTMESLADWVGITRQTLYHHFANKDEIVLRAIVTMVADSITLIEQTDQRLPAIARLQSIMRQMLEVRFSPSRTQFGKARLALMPFKSKPEYLAAFEQRAQALEKIVSQAKRDGDLQHDLPDCVVVQMLLSLVTELNYEQIVTTGSATAEKLIDSVVAVFFHGIATA